MNLFFVATLACALAVESSLGSPEGLTVDPCRPGFSQSFYTAFVSREMLRGQSILKGQAVEVNISALASMSRHILKENILQSGSFGSVCSSGQGHAGLSGTVSCPIAQIA
ncbi:hypothetical protein MHYP_G00267620 [Metynnis hypsauchen]